jgi:hypothetical protein
MHILPGLTSTKKERIPAFLEAIDRLSVRAIALFPTCLDTSERQALYAELERRESLSIPHVHIRSDMDEAELAYLCGRFSAEAFNIHPSSSGHPYPAPPAAYAARIFVENVEEAPLDEELRGLGGICPDYSHWANALAFGRAGYDQAMRSHCRRYPIGCCHLSALRPGVPNPWHGEWDHHEYATLSDLDYLAGYAAFMPSGWASLELENSLEEQLAAKAYIVSRLG